METNKSDYYLIVMQTGDKFMFVRTENDVDTGGFVDADPKYFAILGKENAEKEMNQLKEYANSKGWYGLHFFLEKEDIYEEYDL